MTRNTIVLTENGSSEIDQRHFDTWIHRRVIIFIIVEFMGFWHIITGFRYYRSLNHIGFSQANSDHFEWFYHFGLDYLGPNIWYFWIKAIQIRFGPKPT